AQHPGTRETAVAIAPDLGERYLDTIYQDNWVQGLFGDLNGTEPYNPHGVRAGATRDP
ncbi:2,3-diaminopropionate biosynthesis protein SbnA, partial [Streptomyces sp. NPDC058525]